MLVFLLMTFVFLKEEGTLQLILTTSFYLHLCFNITDKLLRHLECIYFLFTNIFANILSATNPINNAIITKQLPEFFYLLLPRFEINLVFYGFLFLYFFASFWRIQKNYYYFFERTRKVKKKRPKNIIFISWISFVFSKCVTRCWLAMPLHTRNNNNNNNVVLDVQHFQ